MIRKIIHIDEEKCTGCGLCASACHEGAIEMVNGKARLTREDFCDGFGDCLPHCPAGAITFEEREAPAYDERAVKAERQKKGAGCPGTQTAVFKQEEASPEAASVSRLAQWPCQIRLVPVRASFLEGADLLIAADCTAYAYARMHEDFMKGRITLVGCPKLDAVDYSEKLERFFREQDIRSITLVRMEVPCCGGLERAAKKALEAGGKDIPLQVITVSTDGRILKREGGEAV